MQIILKVILIFHINYNEIFLNIGASRDIGAALTRFCLRQKSIENCIRSLATALSDQFAPNLEKKSVEWRQRIQTDFEKRRAKILKKSAKRKTLTDLIENRNCYSELAFEQRDQFVFFVNLLLPVIVRIKI